MPHRHWLLAGVVAIGVAACDSPPPAILGPVRPVLLSISGVETLASAGDQTRFTATARLSDGSNQDVTRQVTWTSTDPMVAVVDAEGLVTAVALGVTDIRASYVDLQAARSLIVSPVPTYTSSGWVRSPGSSALSGVLVSEPMSRRSTLTNAAGEYSMIGLIGPQLVFEKDGYEPVEITAVPNGTTNDAALQLLIRIDAGGEVLDYLAPHDVQYTLETGECGPCRRIRIVAASPGRLTLDLTWTNPRARMRIYFGARVFSAPADDARAITGEIDVAAGETVVYVGGERTTAREYFDYRLTTSFAAR